MLALRHVSKVFDYRPILEDVTLVLEAGTEYALTAPNGSGKTTLLEIMGGISRPTEGQVLWGEKPLSSKNRGHIGTVFQQPMVYGDLTARENLELFARLYNCRNHRDVATEWLERVNLTYAASERVRTFSKGMRQRIALARAMLHTPSLLLLDEPLDGLDSSSRTLIQGVLSDLISQGTTVFKVTHDAEDAKQATVQLTLSFGRVVIR